MAKKATAKKPAPKKKGKEVRAVSVPVVEIQTDVATKVLKAADFTVEIYRHPLPSGFSFAADLLHKTDATKNISGTVIGAGVLVQVEFDTSGATPGDEYKLFAELIASGQTATDQWPFKILEAGP